MRKRPAYIAAKVARTARLCAVSGPVWRLGERLRPKIGRSNRPPRASIPRPIKPEVRLARRASELYQIMSPMPWATGCSGSDSSSHQTRPWPADFECTRSSVSSWFNRLLRIDDHRVSRAFDSQFTDIGFHGEIGPDRVLDVRFGSSDSSV